VADDFDPQEMVARFRARAEAVRNRGIPPIEGADRQRYIEQAQADFMDYAMLGDATATIEDGVLVFRVDLRPDSGSAD
jgi:hypothetical protein